MKNLPPRQHFVAGRGGIRLKKILRFQRELLAVLLSFDRRVFSSRDYTC